MAAGEATETRGAESKLTLARLELIRDLVRQGNYLSVAAEAAGVSERTVYRWMERAQEPDQEAQDSLYWQFWQAVRKAQAEAEQVLVASIERASTGYTKKSTKTRTYTDPETGRECTEVTLEEAEVFDWRAAAWMLQARHRGRWAANPPPATEGEEHVKVIVLPEEPDAPPAPAQIEQPPPQTIDEVI